MTTQASVETWLDSLDPAAASDAFREILEKGRRYVLPSFRDEDSPEDVLVKVLSDEKFARLREPAIKACSDQVSAAIIALSAFGSTSVFSEEAFERACRVIDYCRPPQLRKQIFAALPFLVGSKPSKDRTVFAALRAASSYSPLATDVPTWSSLVDDRIASQYARRRIAEISLMQNAIKKTDPFSSQKNTSHEDLVAFGVLLESALAGTNVLATKLRLLSNLDTFDADASYLRLISKGILDEWSPATVEGTAGHAFDATFASQGLKAERLPFTQRGSQLQSQVGPSIKQIIKQIDSENVVVRSKSIDFATGHWYLQVSVPISSIYDMSPRITPLREQSARNKRETA